MTGAPVSTHQPCPLCGSQDNAIVFADGGTYCYGCKGGTAGDGQSRPQAAPKDGAKGLVECEVQALPKRFINEETAALWKVGYGEHRGEKCQVFSYLDAKGRVVAQKLKFAGKKFEIAGESKRMTLYGQWLWRDSGKMVVVTEGELDALSVSQVQGNKWPVVSIPNGVSSAAKAVAAASEWLEGFEKVVLLFDDDEVGRAAALEAAAVLSPGKAYIGTIAGFKDANEALMAGQSRKIIDALWGAKQWRPDELVTVDDVWQRLLNRESSIGLPIPHSGLMRALRGLRPSEVTVLLAATGAGKSTACREWATALALAGHKVGYVGLEEGVERSLIGFLSVAVSRPLHLEEDPDLRAPDITAVLDKLRPTITLYDAFGSLDPDHLMGKLRFMVKGEGCKVLFVDHLSILTSGGELAHDERRVLDRTMTRLASFVQETKCHVVAVCHLSRREGTPHEEGRRVNMADIRGSHGVAQLAHNIVAIEREQSGEDPNVSQVRVLKNRHVGVTGLVGELEYNTTTGRQVERVSQFEGSTGAADDGTL